MREQRKKLGLSQQDLANQLQLQGLEVSRSSVSNWENGTFNPPLENHDFRYALSKSLKLSVAEILSLSGFETSDELSEDAIRAAVIVDQIPPNKRKMALGILEQILKEG
ncbi:MAG: helix-turn-helix domain-containing protein [Anaerolineae bacterium]|nr:helix-turn-helix domain-containing protein [Anaerolineae bacterium]